MRHLPPPGRATGRHPARASGAALRLLLLAGGAALAVATPASAQGTPSSRAAAARVVPPDDGLGPRDAYIEADVLTEDRETKIVTAKGHVEARTQGRTLRANEVIYDRNTGAAHAIGDVVLVNADGSVQYSQDIQLDEDMRAGVAYGFSSRDAQNVTIAAGLAIRRNENEQQLNNAIFTPCNICTEKGDPKAPTWSIKASRVFQDKKRGVIYYHNAVIRVKNIPIMYFPVFWHPDPSTTRRTGFLTPRVQYSRRRGVSVETPYYWAISPFQELIVSPQFNTRVNPLLNMRYRQRTYSGEIDIRGGFTYEKNFTNDAFLGDAKPRSYVLAQGKFNIDPSWNWGFGIEKVSDPVLFRRYSVEDVFEDRGPYPADTDRLISQIYTRRQDADSFVSVAALSFQSIRAYSQDPVTGNYIGEGSKLFPLVAPIIEARFNPKAPILGGRLRAQFNAVSLTRNNPVSALVDPTAFQAAGPQSPLAIPAGADAITYTDERRATLQADWRRAFTFSNGLRVEPFALGRADLYSIGGLRTTTGATTTVGDNNFGRVLGTGGVDISWPVARAFGSTSVILEPLAQVAISTTVNPDPRIPNEDSVSFQYDETNLFSQNRFSGFDLFEGGRRLNVGARATAYWGSGRRATILVGRTFRDEENLEFSPQSGVRGTASDWIVAATATPIVGVNFFSRSRLDADSFEIHRQELGVNVGFNRINGTVRYAYNQSGLVVQPNGQVAIGESETVDVGGTVFFLPHWGVRVSTTRDLQRDVWPIAQVSLLYQDECIGVDVVYTHDETYGQILGNADSFTVRLNLATLGDVSPRSTGSR